MTCDKMIEGSSMFFIKALVPISESFGFAKEIHTKTHSSAEPQAVSTHWEVWDCVHTLGTISIYKYGQGV